MCSASRTAVLQGQANEHRFWAGSGVTTARDSVATMAEDEKTGREKKVTAATTDAPQEEFISPTNVPSVPESEHKEEKRGKHGEQRRD